MAFLGDVPAAWISRAKVAPLMQGYAHTENEYYLGDISTAVAVIGREGRPIGAINVAVAQQRWDRKADEARISSLLLAAARCCAGNFRATLTIKRLDGELWCYAGVAYVFYLAVVTWRDRSPIVAKAVLGKGAALGLAVKAFLLKIPNPKLTIFFLTFMPQFVEPGTALERETESDLLVGSPQKARE